MASNPSEAPEPATFSPKAPVAAGMQSALIMAGAGTFVSAIQNSLAEHKKGAMGVFTRTGSTIAIFTALGGTYAFTEGAVTNFRESDDAISAAAGGCAAGFVAGANARSLPMMFGSCLAIGTLMGTFRAAGATFSGYTVNSASEEVRAQQGEHGSHSSQEGELGWREQRELRRKRFFKQPKEDTESE